MESQGAGGIHGCEDRQAFESDCKPERRKVGSSVPGWDESGGRRLSAVGEGVRMGRACPPWRAWWWVDPRWWVGGRMGNEKAGLR